MIFEIFLLKKMVVFVQNTASFLKKWIVPLVKKFLQKIVIITLTPYFIDKRHFWSRWAEFVTRTGLRGQFFIRS
jgi:hypothetical protein